MKALGSFLYKAADTRSDALTYGGGGAGIGAGLGAMLAGEGDRASGAGLGALAGGAAGSLYGMNKDQLNDLASNIFTTKDRGNPITTGIGAGVLGAGGLAIKNHLMQSDLPDTFKEHPTGGAAQHHEMLAAMGDVPEASKAKMLAALAAEENRRASGILGGSIKTNPIHDNFLKTLQLTDTSKSWADTLARRLAVKQIMGDAPFLEKIKNDIAASNRSDLVDFNTKELRPAQLAADTAKAEHAKAMGDLVANKNSKTHVTDLANKKNLVDAAVEKLKGLKAPEGGVPDSAGLLKHMSGLKTKVGPWRRYGVAGLGAGALGMMLAGLENNVRS
jgi:hypothetical protein